VNAGISNEFANAAFRFGHTTLSPSLLRTDENHQILDSILLADAFFNTQDVIDQGVDSLLIGLASQKSQAFDPFIVDSVRNFLFPAASGGSDLAAVNIARGREVGIGTLNQVRSALGLIPYRSFAEMNSNPAIIARLSAIYASVEDIDLWVGGLAEMPFSANALLGETFRYIIADQFTRLRDGDRFFYLHDLNDLQLLDPNIAETTLSQLIIRNSTINTMQANAFYYTSVPEPSSIVALLGLGLLGVVQVILAKGLA
ncbi:MAG: peroxidase family protein, partial [Microcystis aeruginosa]